MTKRARGSLSGEQKLSILGEHLVEGKAVSAVCERHKIQPSLFYYWQRQLFENGALAFGAASRGASKRESR